MTDYNNNSAKTTSASNITANQALSLDMPRNTYALSINKGTNISSVSGAGTYRWGQSVTVGATKTTNTTCISYGTPTWTTNAGTAPAAGASSSFVMPKSAATLTATSTAANVAQTITFKTSNAASITLNNNTKTNNQTLSINCGTYNITGAMSANYDFQSWSATAGSFGSTTTLSTTYKVVGPATITLTGKNQTYTVAFNSNGGSGTMSNQTINRGQATALKANSFNAPEHRTFASWNTKADGSGTSYSNQQSVTNLAAAAGSITLYAQWKCPGNTVCYERNDSIVNEHSKMANQSFGASDTSITLWAPNFVTWAHEKGFAGWNTKADGTGTYYGPNQTVSISAGQYSNAGLILYAIWVSSAGNMQNWSGCSSLGSGKITALKDVRDNKVYAVGKLADGKCWMIENLNLGDNQTSVQELSSSNTNNPRLPLKGEMQTHNYIGIPSTDWCRDDNADCVNISHYYDPLYSWTDEFDDTFGSETPGIFNNSYGGFYNWFSATVGNGTYYTYSGRVSGDICPKGWHLPTGSTSGEFATLGRALTSATIGTSNSTSGQLRNYPNNFMFSGSFFGDGIGINFSRRSNTSYPYFGEYWTSSGYNRTQAYSMYFYKNNATDTVYFGTNTKNKTEGFSVRCVAGS